ncbi:MAG TPA: two-component regulator propeller domain-containing protein [Bacteroidota bacterium]
MTHAAFIAACFSLHTPLLAQTPEIRFERLQLERGSTDYRAWDVAQDSIGFLWLGTSNGLYRYDGLGYKIYRPRLNDSTGIASNTIWCLRTDSKGKLWLGTFDGGLACFDPATESFIQYKYKPADSSSISKGAITAILEDRGGTLWVGTERSGLNRFVREQNRFDHFVHNPDDPLSLIDNRIKCLCADSAGNIWIGTDDGVSVLDTRTGDCLPLGQVPDGPSSMRGTTVSSLWCDRSGDMWVGSKERGLARFERSSGRWFRYDSRSHAPYRVPTDTITSIYESAPGHLWLGSATGLLSFDTFTGAVAKYTNDPLNPSSLSSNYVRKVTGDRSGTLWIATDQEGAGSGVRGLNKVVPKAQQFVHFRLTSAKGATSAVLSLYHERSRDALWLGTLWGLRRFDITTGAVTAYVHSATNTRSLSSDIVSALCVDRAGTMWVGTWGDGVNRFETSNGRFEKFALNAGNPSGGNAVIAISEDVNPPAASPAAGTSLWIGIFGDGMVHFSVSGRQMVHYRHNPSDPRSLSNNRVLATCVDHGGILWVGTDGGGLNRFDPSTDSFVHYTHDDAEQGSLRSNRIYAICEDADSYGHGGAVLWVGTATGLDRFDATAQTAAHYTLLDSLSSIGVVAILTTHDQVWASTERNGLFRFSRRTGAWRNYTSEDGLHSDLFTRALCGAPGGELFFGGFEGFTSFHPDSLRENSPPPPVVLTAFNVFDRPLQTSRPLWTRPLIHLRYDQDFFSFQFFALDFTDPAKNRFAYRLEGFDKGWNYPGSRNFAGYTKVDPGEYIFRVKGSNSDGVWNEEGASIDLVIDPPYWRTWWFRVLVGAMILVILVAAYNYRVSKLLEMERMRVRIASDLHDDIGSSLSGIALVTDSMRTRLPLADQDRRRLADVTDTARRTADALRDIVWIVNPDHDKFDDILLRLKDAAAAILVGLEYVVTCPESSPPGNLDMEARRNVILMYKEILNNIVRHARARRVGIVIGEEEGLFVLKVTDDGVGFDAETIKRGNGLDNLQRRARQIGGTIHVVSRPGGGTSIEFSVPLSR